MKKWFAEGLQLQIALGFVLEYLLYLCCLANAGTCGPFVPLVCFGLVGDDAVADMIAPGEIESGAGVAVLCDRADIVNVKFA